MSEQGETAIWPSRITGKSQQSGNLKFTKFDQTYNGYCPNSCRFRWPPFAVALNGDPYDSDTLSCELVKPCVDETNLCE